MTTATQTPTANPITGPLHAFMLDLIPDSDKTGDIPERYLLDLWEGNIRPQFLPEAAADTLNKNFITPLVDMQYAGFNNSYQHRLIDLFADLENFLFNRKAWTQEDVSFNNTAWPKLWETDLGKAYKTALETSDITYRSQFDNDHNLINGLKNIVFEPYYYACQLVTETDIIRPYETTWAPRLSTAVHKYHTDLFTLTRHIRTRDMPL